MFDSSMGYKPPTRSITNTQPRNVSNGRAPTGGLPAAFNFNLGAANTDQIRNNQFFGNRTDPAIRAIQQTPAPIQSNPYPYQMNQSNQLNPQIGQANPMDFMSRFGGGINQNQNQNQITPFLMQLMRMFSGR